MAKIKNCPLIMGRSFRRWLNRLDKKLLEKLTEEKGINRKQDWI